MSRLAIDAGIPYDCGDTLTGNAAMEEPKPKTRDDRTFWIIAVILLVGVMLYNKIGQSGDPYAECHKLFGPSGSESTVACEARIGGQLLNAQR
jgi:hypothetical protein